MPVSAMVVFDQAKENKHAYRRFMIKDAVGGDDYGAMREVLLRDSNVDCKATKDGRCLS